jgi:hypothetical protein
MESLLKHVSPVLPSSDIARDVAWYAERAGFQPLFFDTMYGVVVRDQISLHLQWHAGTVEDPLLGGSVIRIFVRQIVPLFEEFLKRGTVKVGQLRMNTAWHTHEFGFYDLNQNAIFIVEDIFPPSQEKK